MANRVFVYGTLKTGQPNHSMIPGAGSVRCRFFGTGKTETKWPLVIATKYNIPFLLDCEGEGHNVYGEVYEVDDDLLAHLDEVEGCPDSYERRKIVIGMDKIADGSEPNTLDCWCYLLPRYRPSVLSLEKYESYDSNGAHGKQFDKTKGPGEPLEAVHKEIAMLRIR
ncbi:putative gamma-glutamylcyclotransferase CG2811 [Strongylocentrotus purpuratus]|uniref:Gamma-glutamylcyclotransferase family protein n=1 Tax=Strongylocentrotus purpuratus TaxID=7668 RepID=A0A7M7LPN4_STRPU|nr:putative gamma-glutamylcyclotransferase CG2811 [Strongylocentrotus purpuratus]|eukprot:XP_003729532.1 PREDICTED: putative gamma-glutamylcyclotransferase CG2811 [Strongylocentrotus purpuratus]